VDDPVTPVQKLLAPGYLESIPKLDVFDPANGNIAKSTRLVVYGTVNAYEATDTSPIRR
jgi:hypothetical protein